MMPSESSEGGGLARRPTPPTGAREQLRADIAEQSMPDGDTPARIRSMTLTASREGPLPSAAEMRAYGDTDPSLVPAIVDMAQREQLHRHKEDIRRHERDVARTRGISEARSNDHTRQTLAMVILGIVTLSCVGLLFFAIDKGSSAGIVASLTGAITPIVGAFAWHRYSKKKTAGEELLEFLQNNLPAGDDESEQPEAE